jgi:hypothetical protein
MADFCATCWPEVFGEAGELGEVFNDFMGLCGEDEVAGRRRRP